MMNIENFITYVLKKNLINGLKNKYCIVLFLGKKIITSVIYITMSALKCSLGINRNVFFRFQMNFSPLKMHCYIKYY